MAKYTGATVSGFEEYHTARAQAVSDDWTDPDIEAALLRASEWIDNKYGAAFAGYKKDGFLQEREWPRINASVRSGPTTYVFPDTDIPDRVIKAVYEAAYRQLTTPGSLSIDYTPNKYKRASVDGAVSVEYANFNFASDAQTQIPVIDDLLSPLFDMSNGISSSYSGAAIRV